MSGINTQFSGNSGISPYHFSNQTGAANSPHSSGVDWKAVADFGITGTQLLLSFEPMGLPASLAMGAGFAIIKDIADGKSLTDLDTLKQIAGDTIQNWAIAKILSGAGSMIKSLPAFNKP